MKSTDKGIFLQRISFSDSSLIVTFFTLKNGMQKFVFKGGKKKAHNIFPMSLSELTYYGRQDSELLNLTQVEAARPLTFQFDPVKSAVAFFMAETLRKCIAPGQEDESIYDFIEEWVLALETNDNIAVLPLTFLIASSETFGFKPLCEEENAAYFNIDAGMFQHTSSQGDRCRNGAGVDLIRDLINERDFGSPQKEVREQALEIMLEYFRIHIPRFETLDSYDIVKEVLSV